MKRMLLLVGAFAFPAAVSFAQPAGDKPDLAKARTIVDQVCAACHGVDGNSPTPANPNLAGLPAEYISLQLAHFKVGIRANPVMLGMSAALTDADMKALGTYYSQQKPKGLAAKDPALIEAGRSLYRTGVAAAGIPACSACHGPAGAGIPKNYPRLAGQHGDYTLAQLKAFRAGERGADKGGKDLNGRIMATIAARMTDAQMRAAAEFTQGLR
jgi:cytochrome c553